MPVSASKRNIGRLFRQRCVYLFFALITLIMAEPFLVAAGRGGIALVISMRWCSSPPARRCRPA